MNKKCSSYIYSIELNLTQVDLFRDFLSELLLLKHILK